MTELWSNGRGMHVIQTTGLPCAIRDITRIRQQLGILLLLFNCLLAHFYVNGVLLS